MANFSILSVDVSYRAIKQITIPRRCELTEFLTRENVAVITTKMTSFLKKICQRVKFFGDLLFLKNYFLFFNVFYRVM